jgi:integrase
MFPTMRKSVWPPPKDRWPTGFTAHRDGWVKWYAGATRAVCGKSVPLNEVSNRWAERKREIDAVIANQNALSNPSLITYRLALSEFLAVQKARIGAKKNSIEERTYHNYVTILNDFGNFVFEGVKIGDTVLAEIGPRHFSAYYKKFANWKASGFDSVVCRVGTFFRWAIEMEYIEKYRPGPDFVRPAKQELRDQRIALSQSYAPQELAKLYVQGNTTMKCWIALGICAAFNNSDISHLPRLVIDRVAGTIDFRRRKVGKVRRVVPLPDDVWDLLDSYERPDPADASWRDLFFITEKGNPYSRTKSRLGGWNPTCSISSLFARHLVSCQLKTPGRNFRGIRTTFYNRAPRGEWEIERKIIMGRAQGDIDLDSYLEDVGLDRLRHVVNHVWNQVKVEIEKLNTARQDAKGQLTSAVDACAPVASA